MLESRNAIIHITYPTNVSNRPQKRMMLTQNILLTTPAIAQFLQHCMLCT